MSVITELLVPRGTTVEGPDQEESAVPEHLRSVGVRAFAGYRTSYVDPSSVIVVPTAIRKDNPELVIAHERGQRVIHRSQALALAALGMRSISVAGAYGKTATSGMFAISPSACGWDPSMIVGGALPQLGTGAHLGGGSVFIAEADESDEPFLSYALVIEIVTNVEPDYLDRCHSRKKFEGILVEFVRRMVPGGLLVTCAEDEDAVRLVQSTRAEGLRVVIYDRRERSLCAPDVAIADMRMEAQGAGASLMQSGLNASLTLSTPDEHDVLNAVAARVAGIERGLSLQAIADGLGEFTGTVRQFEARGQAGPRRLPDDYAHHLTGVEATIREAHVVAGEDDMAVVSQPRLYLRTYISVGRFAQTLSGADHVMLAGIYGAREDPESGVDSSLISSRTEGVPYIEDMHEAACPVASLIPEGGVCLTMDTGSITRCAPDVLGEWKWMEA